VNFSDIGKSSEAPTLLGFRRRLYIFWKNSVGAKPGKITYTSTEDGEDFAEFQTLAYETKCPPAVAAFGGHLILAYLKNEGTTPPKIFITGSQNPEAGGWCPATALTFTSAGRQQWTATSVYPPTFTVHQNKLTMFWGGPLDSVYMAFLDHETILKPSKEPNKDVIHSYDATKLVDGKWQTKIGNESVCRSAQQWIVTTSKNGEISIATGDEFEQRFNLTAECQAKSAAIVTACVIPGFYGKVFHAPWKLYVVFRGYGVNTTLSEVFVTL
jgi:hypothetical protein